MLRKFLSIVLAVCLLTSLFVSFATARELSETATNSQEFELPDIISEAEAEENLYVGRAEAEEKDLYTFVFENGDGTKTMRVYTHPVKYVADDGSVRDISLDIKTRLGGDFVTADHEITTTFKRKLSDGISLAYNDIAVRLVPQISASTQPLAALSSDSKRVTYRMNDITSFVYELTYTGFKEDIVVEEYTGQTEYEFTLFTNGLTLCEEYGSYYLADAEGNVEATIGDIIVFTADERNNTMGSMTYETVRANQEYTLTIHLDADYLADEDTAYPIRIDPTIEINYDNNGAGAIEDVTINQNVTFSGTSGSLYIGRHPAGSLSRMLMRFPNLSLNGIAADQIAAATVELRDLMCQGDEDITVECRIYNNASPAWSESGTTTWSSVGTAYLGSLLDSHVISYGKGNVSNHRYSFNILTAARAWANGTQSPAKGLVFKANSTFENQTGDAIRTWYKTFASYNRSNYKPSLSITYESTIVLYGITNESHDHITCLNTLSNTIANSTQNDVIVRSGAIASSTCRNDLLSCNVFNSRSHGQWVRYSGTENVAATGIILDDESTDSVAFYSHSWSSMTSGSTYIQTNDNYTGLNVALFIGCNTARGGKGARNLPSAIVEQGASASIGFSQTIGCASANKWTLNFYNKMLQGATLQEAVDYACDLASETSGLKSVVICGDPSITFPIN